MSEYWFTADGLTARKMTVAEARIEADKTGQSLEEVGTRSVKIVVHPQPKAPPVEPLAAVISRNYWVPVTMSDSVCMATADVRRLLRVAEAADYFIAGRPDGALRDAVEGK